MAQAKPRKHKLKAGQKIHSWTLIQRLRDDTTTKSPNLKIRWRCECVCGTRMTLPQYYLVRENPKTDCGCGRKTLKTIYNQEYRIWLMMHVRTEDPTHVAYKHYGGRGIRVCDEWHKSRGDEGFKAFLDFVGPRPSPAHSIDRVDNDLGYQPYQADGVTRQVRWATAKEQRANQRPYTYHKRDTKKPSEQ